MIKKKSKLRRGAKTNAPLFFITTFGSHDTATRFAHAVVEKKLAACVNIIDGVKSVYRWQDKINEDQEIIVVGKTTVTGFKILKKEIKTLHPYDLPELIALKISDGLPQYLEWIIKQSST